VAVMARPNIFPMTKDKVKTLADYIPLLILTVYAVILLWTVGTTNIAFSYEHYTGLTLLVVTIVSFSWRHKLGVLSLGLTLVLGFLKLFHIRVSLIITQLAAH
jgi:hypothetical protein